MRNPTTISIYLHEDLESAVRMSDVGAFSWGNVMSAAIVWSCANCGDPANPQPDDVGKMLASELEFRRIHKRGYAARRTAAQLAPEAFDMLQTLEIGARSRMAVIDACLEFFLRHCTEKREAVEAVVLRRQGPGRAQNREPTAPVPVLFSYDVVQLLRGISAATGLTVPAVVNDIVVRALTASNTSAPPNLPATIPQEVTND